MPAKKKRNRVELDCYDIPIHCVFCGHRVINQPDSSSPEQTPPENAIALCEHTLYVATDEGFEYRSPLFNSAMGLPATTDQFEQPDIGENSYDGFTDKVSIANAIRLEIYIPAPSFFGCYIGFAPKTEK